MRTCKPLAAQAKAWLVVSMAWVAGFVDVVGWIAFYHVYISHMTGNTATFAHAVATAQWKDAMPHGWPILPFIGGLLYGAGVSRACKRRRFHYSVAVGFMTELALLAIVLAVGKKEFVMSWLLAAAMGIQTVTVTRVKGLRVYSTYITGTLSKFAEAVTEYAFWFYDRTRGRFWSRFGQVIRLSPRRTAFQHVVLTWGLWTGFFFGALCGALADARFGLRALVAPILALAAGIAIDLARPVAAAEEATGR